MKTHTLIKKNSTGPLGTKLAREREKKSNAVSVYDISVSVLHWHLIWVSLKGY